MNILITGGCGFIGSNFIESTLNNPSVANIVNIDLLTYAATRHEFKLNRDGYFFYNLSILDQNKIQEILLEHKIDVLVNFAAESHVDNSIQNFEPFLETNVQGTISLLEASRNYLLNAHLKNENFLFMHISTDEVFGSLGFKDRSFKEKSPMRPNSPYSASKASSENFVRSWGATYGIPYLISNCSNNFGPWQHSEKLIPKIINNALNHEDIPIYGVGENIRDWLYVEDHCNAVNMLINSKMRDQNINIGGGNEISNLEIANKICDILDDSFPSKKISTYRNLIKFVDDRKGHDLRYSVNFDKIKKELNWEPSNNFNEKLSFTVKWYSERILSPEI